MSHPLRPIVSTWDVFDTLLARFVDVNEIFQLVEARNPGSNFVQRRLAAQADLDRIGNPYVLYDIYDAMIEKGLPTQAARKLLGDEIAAERENLFPIRRNILRVEQQDLIVSDMYLPPELIDSFLFEIGEMTERLPLVASNWGKGTGTIWKELLQNYVIRFHHGDNPKSDYHIPVSMGISCEVVDDAKLTDWETTLHAMDLKYLARIQREVRLRSVEADFGLFQRLIVGPYLSLLVGYAVHLVQKFGESARFAFLSRDCDDLSRVFRVLFPGITAFNIDLSRKLLRDLKLDPFFASRIDGSTVVVDMLSTGRSFFMFADRTGAFGKTFAIFMFLEKLLSQKQKLALARHQKAGQFYYFQTVPESITKYTMFECLLQSHYPPVTSLTHDSKSGGVVRSYGMPELARSEQELISWKSRAVSELTRTLLRRGLDRPNETQTTQLLNKCASAILGAERVIHLFPSFYAREQADQFHYPDWPS